MELITTIPVITAITYAIIEIIKTAVRDIEKIKRFFPLIACSIGVACGLLAFLFIPGVLPTVNVLTALVIGGASGLAATGIYENIKQIFVKKENENGSVDNNNSNQ
jgi:hypothetical protein